MSTKILLQNMMFYGFHGVQEFERELGQRFYLDVEFVLNSQKSESSDVLQDTVDYATLYGYIKEVVENHRYQLLEALGAHIADMLLQQALISEVTVRIRKPYVPIPGQIDYVQAEVRRKR